LAERGCRERGEAPAIFDAKRPVGRGHDSAATARPHARHEDLSARSRCCGSKTEFRLDRAAPAGWWQAVDESSAFAVRLESGLLAMRFGITLGLGAKGEFARVDQRLEKYQDQDRTGRTADDRPVGGKGSR